MGFDELGREILHTAFGDVKRITAEADAEEKRILGAAEAERARLIDSAKAEAAAAAAAERGERLAAARLTGRTAVAKEKEALVARVVDGVREKLYGVVDTDRYAKLLNSLVEDGVAEAGRGATVRVNARDKKKLKRFADAKVGESVGIAGGAVITSADGRVTVRNTLEGLFEERVDAVRACASEALFKGGDE